MLIAVKTSPDTTFVMYRREKKVTMTLGTMLGHVGHCIGKKPLTFLLISFGVVALSLLSFVLRPPSLVLSFDNGYTDSHARSIKELQAHVEYFGSRGKPWYLALFAEPKSEYGSMSDTKEFAELEKFYKTAKSTIQLRDNANVTYMDICETECGFNDVVFTTFDGSIFGMRWPVTTLWIYKSNIGKNFFDNTFDKDGIITKTNMTALYFMAFSNSSQKDEDLATFERKLHLAATEHNANNETRVKLTVHGAEGMQAEVRRGVENFAKQLLFGFACFSAIIFLWLFAFDMLYGRSGILRCLALSTMIMIVPIFASLSAASLTNLFLGHFNTICFLVPILAVVSSIHGALVLHHTWLYESHLRQDSTADILREVFASSLPSLLITFSSSIGFLVGYVFPIPEYAVLSVFIGFTLLMTLVFEILFYTPLLTWLAKPRHHKSIPTTANNACPRDTCFFFTNLEKYSQGVTNSKVLLVFAVALLAFAIVLPTYFGNSQVKGNIDYRQLIPENSPNRAGVHYMSDVVWPQFLHLVFIVRHPPQFTDPMQYGRFKAMIHELEAINNTIGPEADMAWIKDFCFTSDCDFDDAVLPMEKFDAFIEDNVYKAWKTGVHYTYGPDGLPVINEMVYMIAFNETRSMADKVVLFKKCREVVERYPEFETRTFDTEVGMADVIDQVPFVLKLIPLFALLAFSVFELLIIRNIFIALINLVAVILIYGATVCIPALLGYTTNPFSATFFLFAVAVAPMFPTPFIVFYQQGQQLNNKAAKEDRMNEALKKSSLVIIATAVSGLVFMSPVFVAVTPIFKDLAFYTAVLNGFGVVIGIFLMPIFINIVPESLNGNSFLGNHRN